LARLLRAQPVGHGSRVKAYTGADAEAWDPAGFCLFEDRDGGDARFARPTLWAALLLLHSPIGEIGQTCFEVNDWQCLNKPDPFGVMSAKIFVGSGVDLERNDRAKADL